MFSKQLRLLILAAAPILLHAQNLQEFEKRVTEFTLPNGMHWIVYERHEAPVVSFNSFVNAGAVDDPAGESSMAHMFEHMIGRVLPPSGRKIGRASRKRCSGSNKYTTATKKSIEKLRKPTRKNCSNSRPS